MTTKKRLRTGFAALAAGAAILGTLAVSDIADAAPGDPPFAGSTISIAPPNGTSGTTYALNFSATSFCPGDDPAGYRWSAYVVPNGTDIGALTWTTQGNPVVPSGGNPALFRPLTTTTGVLVRGQSPGLSDGLIIPPTGLWFGTTALTPGQYQVGIACYNIDVAVGSSAVTQTNRYWATPLTVTAATGAGPQNFNYANGFVPAAPVLTSSTYNAATTTSTVNFTHAASTPATTGYVATLTSITGPTIAPINVPAGATSFQIPGIDLGEAYTVTLVANNGIGTGSAPSNVLTVTGAVTAPAPVVNAPDAFVGNPLTVTWTAPASGPTPASYDVAIAPGGPTFTGVTGLSQVVRAGLALGSYTATVTPNYAAGSGVTGTAGSDGFSITPNTLVVQEITVTRPPGALILTQRCGVFGPLDTFTAVDAFPGYPRTLTAATATTDQTGTSPDINLSLPGVQVDPEFGNYPEPTPPSYPTECGLSMGAARLVTSGSLAGQFYTASGRMNEVTVLDSRDTDTGWIARGDIDDTFTGSTGDSFDGDYLGWDPQLQDDSDPVGGSTYDQVVTAGDTVLPGSNTTAATAGAQIGMTENPILGSTPANAGLGIAQMDARMLLLIPASADAADYSATLSLTVVPRP